MTKVIGVINGPNLNLLGERDPTVYGSCTLAEIVDSLTVSAESNGFTIEHFQSNCEGAIVDAIQSGRNSWEGLIINAAAFSHTSIAIADALRILSIPIIEVHLSNIHSRESFRHHSYVSSVAKGVIVGLGKKGYLLALDALFELVASPI